MNVSLVAINFFCKEKLKRVHRQFFLFKDRLFKRKKLVNVDLKSILTKKSNLDFVRFSTVKQNHKEFFVLDKKTEEKILKFRYSM